MPPGPTFRQRDLTAAIKALIAAGREVAWIEIDPITGRIIISTTCAAEKDTAAPLDQWLAKHAD